MTQTNRDKRWQNNPERKVGKTQLQRVMRAEKSPESASYEHYRELLTTRAAPVKKERPAL